MNKLFQSLCSDILIYNHEHNTNDYPFRKKITQCFANFWDFCGNFKAKIIFAPPQYLSRVKGYSQLLLCEAPKWSNLTRNRNWDERCLYFGWFDWSRWLFLGATCGSSNKCVTNQPTERPTDTASYRGALSHLKRRLLSSLYFNSDQSF